MKSFLGFSGSLLALTLVALLAYAPVRAAEPLLELKHNPFDSPGMAAGASAGRDGSGAPKWTRKLKATLVSSVRSIANMDGTLVAVGDAYQGYTLINVGEGSATFRKDQETWELHVEGDTDEDDDSR